MGENNAEKNLVFTIDGKDYSSLIRVADIAESVEGGNLSNPIPFIPTGIEITLNPMPKVSRRRFVKLLMADGISRNGANEVANMVTKNRVSFSAGLVWWRLAKILP